MCELLLLGIAGTDALKRKSVTDYDLFNLCTYLLWKQVNKVIPFLDVLIDVLIGNIVNILNTITHIFLYKKPVKGHNTESFLIL